jgi:hypothetical protein
MANAQPLATTDARLSGTTGGIAVALLGVQILLAVTLAGFGWTAHYAHDATGGMFEVGPFFLAALGCALVGWGAWWARVWTIAVGTFMFLFVGYVLVRGILDHQAGLPGLDALLRAIIGLVQLAFCLLTLVVQVLCVVFVLWRREWQFWRNLNWRMGAVEIAELLVAAALVPVLYHFDFIVPARLQAQQQAGEAAEVARYNAEIEKHYREERERNAARQ